MLATRYRSIRDLCQGNRVLEVAYDSGQGLGYLSQKTLSLVEGNYDAGLLKTERKHYENWVGFVPLDTHSLPFCSRSFDVVILFEALYYLHSPEIFLEECRRVLSPTGLLLVCMVNREWPEFNLSPFSEGGDSAQELRGRMEFRVSR